MTEHTHRMGGQTLTHTHGGDEVAPWVAPGAPERVRISLHGYFGHVEDAPNTHGREATDDGHAGIILLAGMPAVALAVAFVARLLGTLAGTVTP